MAKICDRIQSPNEDFTVLVKKRTDEDFMRLDSQDTRYLDGIDLDNRHLDGIDLDDRHFDDEDLGNIRDKENGRFKD